VASEAQRKGVATAMLSALVARAKTRAWDDMFVLTNARNEAAMTLYQALGAARPNDDDVLFDFHL
jgi:ribosomal protein S18 acetylase RimI-like enzyme